MYNKCTGSNFLTQCIGTYAYDSMIKSILWVTVAWIVYEPNKRGAYLKSEWVTGYQWCVELAEWELEHSINQAVGLFISAQSGNLERWKTNALISTTFYALPTVLVKRHLPFQEGIVQDCQGPPTSLPPCSWTLWRSSLTRCEPCREGPCPRSGGGPWCSSLHGEP